MAGQVTSRHVLRKENNQKGKVTKYTTENNSGEKKSSFKVLILYSSAKTKKKKFNQIEKSTLAMFW